jgi:hypothetical protein
MNWYFVPTGSGVQPAETVANPLANTKLSPAELLARESLQNSVDETIDGRKLIFKVRKHLLSGDEKRALIEHFQFNALREKAQYFNAGNNSKWFKDGFSAFEKLLTDAPIPVLEISDVNANGLTGDWHDGREESDRFFNLVLSEYRTQKALDGRKLGSYGIGKVVFARASDIRTVIYYSKFRPDARSNHDDTRLMSVAYLPEFRENEIPYAGYAYFGEESEIAQYPRCPIVGSNADEIVSSLGMEIRDQKDLGTSVYIPFCDIEVADIRAAIEKWWWPYLEKQEAADGIEIIIEDANGESLSVDHGSRRYLKPFLGVQRDMAANFSDGDTYLDKVLAATPKRILAGEFGAQAVAKRDIGELNNRVALVRGGLVISYEEYFKEDEKDCVGVFVADGKASNFFVSSEPEAHDQWNDQHSRLRDHHGEVGAKFIKSALSIIADKAKTYQLQRKAVPEKQTDSLAFLDKALAPLLKPRKKGGGVVPAKPRLPFIRKTSKRVSVKGKSYDEIEFEVGLKDGDHSMAYELQVSLSSLVDSNAAKGEKIVSKVELFDGETRSESEVNKMQIHLESGNSLIGSARASVSPSWSTIWTIALEPRE